MLLGPCVNVLLREGSSSLGVLKAIRIEGGSGLGMDFLGRSCSNDSICKSPLCTVFPVYICCPPMHSNIQYPVYDENKSDNDKQAG
jgi:hypothetical protein